MGACGCVHSKGLQVNAEWGYLVVWWGSVHSKEMQYLKEWDPLVKKDSKVHTKEVQCWAFPVLESGCIRWKEE